MEAVAKLYSELLGCLTPVSQWLSPLLFDVSIGKIYEFEECVVIWENSHCLRYLTYLTLITFYNVGSIHNTSDWLRIVKIVWEVIPLLAVTAITLCGGFCVIKVRVHLTLESWIEEISQYTMECTILTKQRSTLPELFFCLKQHLGVLVLRHLLNLTMLI